MRLIRLLNDCHHFPGFVYQGAQLNQETTTIEVQVRPRRGAKAICSGCGCKRPGYDTLPVRRFEFIPVWGYFVVLQYAMRRVACPTCGVIVEQVPWGIGKHSLCKVYMQFLAGWARRLSWKETAQCFRTTWDKVADSVEYIVKWGLEHRVLGVIRAAGVDEISYGRGHNYLSLVYQIEAGCIRLLWIGKARTEESFKQFFDMLGAERASQIEFFCSDMWKPFVKLIKLHCPNALNILDRFHIVAKLNDAIDEVRAGEARQMALDGYEPVLKKSRWCLLKNKVNLTDQQRGRLRDLLRYNLKSVRAYLLKETFQQVWEYTSPFWAGKFLDQWCTQAMRSRIEPMKKVARTIRNHRDLILNYFHARKQFSSGVIEGLNNKAKVTMRKSYGYRTFRIAELSLYHVLGKLPEPPLAHTFF